MADDRFRILVVEDNLLNAIQVGSLLEACGSTTIGPCSSVEKALTLIRRGNVDAADLDLHLGREWVWPIAEFLEEQAVPFIFISGFGSVNVPKRFKSRPLLSKPLTLPPLRSALRGIGFCA